MLELDKGYSSKEKCYNGSDCTGMGVAQNPGLFLFPVLKNRTPERKSGSSRYRILSPGISRNQRGALKINIAGERYPEEVEKLTGKINLERKICMRGNILIAYYSCPNARKLAQLIHQKVGGTVHEIQPEIPILLHTTQLWNRPKRKFRPVSDPH